MTSLELEVKVNTLISELDEAEPVSFDLGTPEILDSDAMHQLVSMGDVIVPYLIIRMSVGTTKKQIVYIVRALGKLKNVQALEPLRELRTSFQEREFKDEWDYAVIGECNLTIDELYQQKYQ